MYCNEAVIDWGVDDLTSTPSSGSVHCHGTITATFTWHSDYEGQPNADDDPPLKAVVIAETCDTSWNASSDNVAPYDGHCDNGLGFGETTQGPVFFDDDTNNTYGESKGTR